MLCSCCELQGSAHALWVSWTVSGCLGLVLALLCSARLVRAAMTAYKVGAQVLQPGPLCLLLCVAGASERFESDPSMALLSFIPYSRCVSNPAALKIPTLPGAANGTMSWSAVPEWQSCRLMRRISSLHQRARMRHNRLHHRCLCVRQSQQAFQ